MSKPSTEEEIAMACNPLPTSCLLFACLAAAISVGACGGGSDSSSGSKTVPQPTQAQLDAANLGKLPLAPQSKRVDIEAPTFSDSTNVTNPLFPISELRSAILSGKVDGKPFHTETTLLPETKVIDWNGQRVETLVSQYMAYLDGRLQETALDFYAQADDGSVWYFGEEVSDYRDGLVFSTEGTWLTPKDGPAAMIMPGDPKVGDVHRAENFPGIAFEEVAIKALNKTVNGPRGPVERAMVGRELHDDGSFSDKVFAPGYGEFLSRHRGDVEAMALALPTDKLSGPPPAELTTLTAGAEEVFDAVRSGDWKPASASLRKLTAAWDGFKAGDVPPRLATEMERALEDLAGAIDARKENLAGTAAIDVAQSALDLELRHLPPARIDLARFELWARQMLVDAAAGDPGGVTNDLVTLEWVRDRFAHTLDPVDATRIDAQILDLHAVVDEDDLRGAAAEAKRLRETLEQIHPTG
jgi:hypothetical protein